MDDEPDVRFRSISIERCRELLGDEAEGLSDLEVDQIRRHAEAMAHVIVEIFLRTLRTGGVGEVSSVPITLPRAIDGAKLRPMIGAVIYVRVSTKEQTENLSLPTQLRACEEYCRREGYEVLERFSEEGESAKTTDRTELQKLLKLLPHAQRQGSFRRRLQPDALRAREVRPLRAARPPEIAGHLPAVSHGADRRHVHRKADGRRPGCLRAIRQRRAVGTDARGNACGAGTRSVDVRSASWLSERAEMVRQEPGPRPGARRRWSREPSRNSRRVGSPKKKSSTP